MTGKLLTDLKAAENIGGFSNCREELPMEDFSFTIMKMQSMFHRQLLKGLEGSGLSTGQPKVLAFLNSHEGLAQKEIAKACQLEPGSVTVLLKRMEQQGMVERRVREGDSRNRCVFLTPLGRDLAKKAVSRFYEVEEMAFSGFSEEEKKCYLAFCERMLKNLNLNNDEDSGEDVSSPL